MLKKIIAASAMLALFACSSDNDDDGGRTNGDGTSSTETASSSSEEENGSSSSVSTSTESSVPIASFNNRASELFGSTAYPYNYTISAGRAEDLTQFWDADCPTTIQENNWNNRDDAACEIKEDGIKVGAILQNNLTVQGSDLRYKINDFRTSGMFRAIKMDGYSLTQTGDQAALGLNVYPPPESNIKNIGELGINDLNGIISFSYKYLGGEHTFRAVTKTDNDFWIITVPASATETEIEIEVSEFEEMGSLAENEEGTPFDISKVAKFLWIVEFDGKNSENNNGSLLIYDFKATVAAQ